MATVPLTAKDIPLDGAVVFWTARRILRQGVADALGNVGIATLPPVDHYDALVESGMEVVTAGSIKQPRCPVKADSLSRSGVGCEFYQTFKGDQENRREFLFSLGVDDKNRAFPLKVGSNPAIQKFFNDPDADRVLNGLYQNNLLYMPSRDVTDALTGLVGSNRGIRLKETGGVYFVPECAIGKVDSVFIELNRAGCRCTMLKHDLKKNTDLCCQVLEATDEQLHENLKQMQDEIRDLLDNGKKPRINGMKTKMQQLAKYADLLDYYQKMFGQNLNSAQANLQATFDLLSELQIRYQGGDQ